MHIVDETYNDELNFLGWYDEEGNFIPTKETIETFNEAEEEDIEQVNKHIV